MSVRAAEFRLALGQFATGVTVVLTRDESGRPLGLTANAFCSVSLAPPLILVCVDRRSEAHAGFTGSGRFGISVLAADQEPVSRRFAGEVPDKFSGFEFETGPHGCLLVPGALARLECALMATHEGGDHRIYVGQVLGLDTRPGEPLVYHGGRYVRLEPGVAGGRERDQV